MVEMQCKVCIEMINIKKKLLVHEFKLVKLVVSNLKIIDIFKKIMKFLE